MRVRRGIREDENGFAEEIVAASAVGSTCADRDDEIDQLTDQCGVLRHRQCNRRLHGLIGT